MDSTIKYIWLVLFILGAGQGLFLTIVILLRKAENKKANFILAALIFSISYIFIVNILHLSGLHRTFTFLLGTGLPFWYSLAPLFYLYVIFLLSEKVKFHWHQLIHSIPFMIVIALQIPFYSMNAENKLQYLSTLNNMNVLSAEYIFLSLLYFIPFIIYLVLIVQKIYFYKNSFINQNSKSLLYTLYTIQVLYIILFLFLIIDFGSFVYLLLTGESWKYMTTLILSVNSILIYILAYMAITNNKTIFPQVEKISDTYKTSSLTAEDITDYKNQLVNYIENEKVYLDSNLKLSDLSQLLNIPAHNLSQVLNQNLNSNFYDFINRYRIKEAQQKILDQQNKLYTILSIAMDVGFSNKASFNRAFKKYTGMTPSAFIKNQTSEVN